MSEKDIKKFSEQECRALLHELLDVAENMLLTGSEVYRVEDTLCRMGEAAGADQVNAFVITSSIVVTIHFEGFNPMTESRRVRKSSGNDFIKLEKFNALSREFCNTPCSVEELHTKTAMIMDEPVSSKGQYLGSMIAAGGLAVFFGGTIPDGLVAGPIFGTMIAWFSQKFRKYCPNTVVFNVLCSFVCGLLICLLAKVFPMLHPDKIMIGDIMLLIPGIALTVSVRDVLVGDTISGFFRLIESVLWAAGIVYGFMLAIMLVGGVG